MHQGTETRVCKFSWPDQSQLPYAIKEESTVADNNQTKYMDYFVAGMH